MWKWTDGNYKQINFGVQEPNMVNVGAGLASQGKRVIIYGVAGFVLYKSFEQIKFSVKGWGELGGSIIFVNAGYNGCYSVCGRGHLVKDDFKLLDAANVPIFDPPDRSTFVKRIVEGLKQPGVRFIRLGWDNAPWKSQ